MTPAQFDQALLVLRSWQAAKSDNIDELLAVMCTLRNRVLAYGKTYIQVCEAAEINRLYPDIRHPHLIHPTNGILAAVEGIYKNETPDLTSNHLHKNGALYFARVVEHQGTGDDFEERIIKQYEAHPLIGTFGTQQFFE
jgi:hypothetical protein